MFKAFYMAREACAILWSACRQRRILHTDHLISVGLGLQWLWGSTSGPEQMFPRPHRRWVQEMAFRDNSLHLQSDFGKGTWKSYFSAEWLCPHCLSRVNLAFLHILNFFTQEMPSLFSSSKYLHVGACVCIFNHILFWPLRKGRHAF